MKNNITALLGRAAFLSQDQKDMYAAMVETLSGAEKLELERILEEGLNEEDEVAAELYMKKNKSIERFVADSEAGIRKEYEASINNKS